MLDLPSVVEGLKGTKNMQSKNISFEILAHKKPVQEFYHEGKTFVEARDGSQYAIRVKNQTAGRIVAVISVDGLNIINGIAATDKPTDPGYILGPHEEQVFTGYRVDKDTVASFTFTHREKSYATERGQGQSNGVIAVRAYAEKEDKLAQQLKDLKKMYDELKKRPPEKEHHYWPSYPWYWENPWYDPLHQPHRPNPIWYGTTSKSGLGCNGIVGSTLDCSFGDGGQMRAMNCVNDAGIQADCSFAANAAAEPQAFDMGSGWGAAVKDSVKEVPFEVGVFLAEETFYYASLDSLKAMGIDVSRTKSVVLPQAFKQEYCAKPSGWKG